jgi:AhpC/TSA family
MAEVDRLRAIGPLTGQLAVQLCNEGVALLGLRRGKRGEELLCFGGNPSCKLWGLLLGQFDQASRDLLDGIASGAALDATVVGISSQDLASHEGFIEKNGLTVPLLADVDKSVARLTAPILRAWAPSARRS